MSFLILLVLAKAKLLNMGDSLEKGTTEGGRIQRLITNLLYTPMKKYLLNHDC